MTNKTFSMASALKKRSLIDSLKRIGSLALRRGRRKLPAGRVLEGGDLMRIRNRHDPLCLRSHGTAWPKCRCFGPPQFFFVPVRASASGKN